MRIICGFLAFFVCTALRGAEPAHDFLVETAITKGVVLCPAEVPKNALDGIKYFYVERRIAFWTPSRDLIANVEEKISVAQMKVRGTDAITPPGGFHYGDYYTPKHYSRDRVRHVPAYVYSKEYVFFSEFMKEMQSSRLRQYLGIVINGKKALLVNFLGDQPKANWKSVWVEHAFYVYFYVAPDQVTPTDYVSELIDG